MEVGARSATGQFPVGSNCPTPQEGSESCLGCRVVQRKQTFRPCQARGRPDSTTQALPFALLQHPWLLVRMTEQGYSRQINNTQYQADPDTALAFCLRSCALARL